MKINDILESLKKRLVYFTPKKYKQMITRQIRYAGLKPTFVNKFLVFSLIFSLAFGLTFGFFLWLYSITNLYLHLTIVTIILCFIFIQVSIVLIADSRAAEVENILPDALQLMAANIRAGMTIDKAIWLSARPEFGLFEEEIRRAGAKSVAGKPLKKALTEMTERINSDVLDKTIKLLIEGIEAGGELAKLLEEIANNIRTKQVLKKEIKTSVTAYSMFILFASGLGAPALFAIGLFFVEVMVQLWSPDILGATEAMATSGGGGFLTNASGPTITPDQLFWFIIAALTTTGFFGSLIIGLIQTGREKNGLKYIPLLITGSILVFLFVHQAVSSMFGSFFMF